MEKLDVLKASLAAFFGAVAALLEWRGVLFVILFALMLIDYFSGWVAALKNGEWKSAIARAGVAHKLGMLLIVAASGIADIAVSLIFANVVEVGYTWDYIIFPLVVSWYILAEFGSIIENAILLGAPVPEWLKKMLDVGRRLIDGKADMEDTEK